MALENRYQRNGHYIPIWYGRVTINGKPKTLPLKTVIKGNPPLTATGRITLKSKGDEKFEISRARALDELESLTQEAKRKGRADHIAQSLIESKTGEAVEDVKLADLADRWRKLSRDKPPKEEWLEWCDSIFSRFAEDVRRTYLYEVTQEVANSYVQTLRNDFTQSTASRVKSLLKSAFTHLMPTGMKNPFKNAISNNIDNTESGTIHRRPLTATELKTLFETARTDPLVYALAVCAACTGMRIGDVCLLKWESVDMREGFIAVKTAKTGATVEIPIFQPLREVLEVALSEKGESSFVWPAAEAMYQRTRKKGKFIGTQCRGSGITYRGKVLFAKAFARKADTPQDVLKGGQIEAKKPDLAKILPKVLEAVRGAGFAQGKEVRIVDTLTRYARGDSYRDIERVTGRRRSIVSQDLHDAELVSGYRLRQGLIGERGTSKKSGQDLKTLINDTRQKRKDGEKGLSASLLGWHSLRGTFVTLALTAGVPIETIKKITGHTLVETIIKYYHNPQREHMREVLGDKLPNVLTGIDKTKIKALPPASPNLDAIAKKLGLTKEKTNQLKELLNLT